MKKVYNVFLPVLKGFLYCFAILQIILGVVYIGTNFGTVPQFQDTEIYLEMAEKFIADEYTGLLYPLLVRLCFGVLGSYYHVPIYLLQMALGFLAVYHFISAFTERKVLAVICSGWINAIPFVLQVHLTVLPYSLVFTFLVLMLQEVVKATVQKRTLSLTEWAVLLCSFTILCQLTRGFMGIGLLFVGWAVLLQLYAVSHRWLTCLVSCFICIGITVCNHAIYYCTENEGYYGRIQSSAEAMFFQRTAAPVLSDKYMLYMPEEISECFTGAELSLYSRYPYKLQTEMGPKLEARYGKERAAEIYLALGTLGVDVAAKDNLKAYVEDTLSYAFPEISFMSLRDGNVKGMTSWNYQQFIQKNPVFAIYYFNISQHLWIAGVVLMAVGAVMRCLHRRGLKEGLGHFRLWLPIVLLMVGYGAFIAIRGAGIYDYKMALLPEACMYIPVCIGLFLQKET